MLTLAPRTFCVPLVLILTSCANELLDASSAHSSPAEARAPTIAATHGGIVSIQDVTVENLPEAGHGLTVQALFTPLRTPDFVEGDPGTPLGCRASAYELAVESPPPEQDQGELTLQGLRGGSIQCRLSEARGYVCPTMSGASAARVTRGGAATTYTLDGGAVSDADVGRYLQIAGASRPENNGAFAILSRVGPDTLAVANPSGASEMFDATYTVLAGAGPTPGDLYSPFVDETDVGVSLHPGGSEAFDAFDVQITPGSHMTPDRATRAQIVGIEPNGDAITLGCTGEGGECGAAAATVIRITTTDGDTTGLSPIAMPPAKHWVVEIQCALSNTGEVRVPAEAMALVRMAHERAPITRIRTAFMREGFAIVKNAAPRPPNVASILVGHGVLGFSNPGPD